MANKKPTSFSLLHISLLFSLLPLSAPLPSSSILSAAATLSSSGYISMSLTLQLTYQTLATNNHLSATLFSPPDSAFAAAGQPSLPLLRFHLLPLAFSFDSLLSLPFNTKIPTMFPGHSLSVTSSNSSHLSLNNVSVVGSPLFDDGSLVVFAVDRFFDPNFTNNLSLNNPASQCNNSSSSSFSFGEASRRMRSRGFAIMATFLDLQLVGDDNWGKKVTVFAPGDGVLVNKTPDFGSYSSLFLRHVVPCKLTWSDLGEGLVLRTYLEGFGVGVSKLSGVFFVNDVAVNAPDLYSNDWLVVHGVADAISFPKGKDQYGGGGGHEVEEEDGVTGTYDDQEISMAPNYREF